MATSGDGFASALFQYLFQYPRQPGYERTSHGLPSPNRTTDQPYRTTFLAGLQLGNVHASCATTRAFYAPARAFRINTCTLCANGRASRALTCAFSLIHRAFCAGHPLYSGILPRTSYHPHPRLNLFMYPCSLRMHRQDR